MQTPDKKPKKVKQNTQEDNNPFDDLLFWLTLAATDFSCVFENKQTDCDLKN